MKRQISTLKKISDSKELFKIMNHNMYDKVNGLFFLPLSEE